MQNTAITISKEADQLIDPSLMSPRSVGDVISSTVRICRRNVKILMSTLIWPTAASAGAQVIALFGLIMMESAISPTGEDVTSWSALLQGCGIMCVGLLVALPVQVLLVMRQLAILRVVARFSTTLKEADKFLWRNFWKFVLVGLLYYGLITVWFVIWCAIIVALAIVCAMIHAPILTVAVVLTGFFLGFASTLLFMVPLAIIAPALACDNKGLGTILKDSTSLAFRNFWRTSGFCSLLILTVWLLGAVLGLPGQICYLVEYLRAAMAAGTLPKSVDIPFYAQVVTTVWHSVVNIFLGPVVSISAGLYYFDLRVREEGLDLVRLVQSQELSDNSAR